MIRIWLVLFFYQLRSVDEAAEVLWGALGERWGALAPLFNNFGLKLSNSFRQLGHKSEFQPGISS